MVQLTRNFTSEVPLHGAVIDAISAAFEAGWADPKKISQASAKASALRAAAIEEIAEYLKVSPSAIEPVGEPALIHQLAIEGFLREGAHLVTTNLDIGKIRAVAHHYAGPKSALHSDSHGRLHINTEEIKSLHSPTLGSVMSLQERNGEIGTTQDLSALIDRLPSEVRIVQDSTRAIPLPLNARVSAATFEAAAWQGPTGLGFLVIQNSEKYRYPLPHLAPIRTPGTYSLPLLVGAIVALEKYQTESKVITELRSQAISELSAIPRVNIVGDEFESNSRYLSIIVDGAIAQELTRELNTRSIAIDAGSACSPDYLAPSHVITSLGFKSEGHLRITFNTSHTPEDISALTAALSSII